MDIFEEIISAPIFLQVPVFGLQLAIILYQLEYVSNFCYQERSQFEAPISEYPPKLDTKYPHLPYNNKILPKHSNRHRFLVSSLATQSIAAPLSVILCIGELLYYGLNVYLLCYFISIISIDTGAIGMIAYDSPWHQMGHTEHRIIEMVLRRSQRPCDLKGLGVVICSLETYGKVQTEFMHFLVFGSNNNNNKFRTKKI